MIIMIKKVDNNMGIVLDNDTIEKFESLLPDSITGRFNKGGLPPRRNLSEQLKKCSIENISEILEKNVIDTVRFGSIRNLYIMNWMTHQPQGPEKLHELLASGSVVSYSLGDTLKRFTASIAPEMAKSRIIDSIDDVHKVAIGMLKENVPSRGLGYEN